MNQTKNVSYSYDDYYSDDDYSSDSDKDPLHSLRNSSRFAKTREEVLKMNIDSINSIFSKDFFSSNVNKQLLENIILNQEIFLKWMTEKKMDNVDTMTCDIDLNDSDNLAIKKITDLGFSESEVVQAYFACNKDENATLDLLNNNS